MPFLNPDPSSKPQPDSKLGCSLEDQLATFTRPLLPARLCTVRYIVNGCIGMQASAKLSQRTVMEAYLWMLTSLFIL